VFQRSRLSPRPWRVFFNSAISLGVHSKAFGADKLPQYTVKNPKVHIIQLYPRRFGGAAAFDARPL
jgi:hypothetical protein